MEAVLWLMKCVYFILTHPVCKNNEKLLEFNGIKENSIPLSRILIGLIILMEFLL